MCVDDYEFRSYSAVRPKQCRRFTFINEDDIGKSFLVNISQFQEEGEVALCKIIIHLSSKGLSICGRQFYWPKYNVTLKPGDYCKVPFSTLADKQIIFHTTLIFNTQDKTPVCSGFNDRSCMDEQIPQKKEETDDGSMGSGQCEHCEFDQMKDENCMAKTMTSLPLCSKKPSETQETMKEDDLHSKRIKQPQRLIGQVIIALKKWRKLYESKKLNLTKAAKVIGISKKSLDDYFLVLRVGEILGFEFSQNLNHKMGDLRAYIRAFDHKVTGKLSKQVKCFSLVPDFEVDDLLSQEHEGSLSSHNSQDQN